MYKSQVGYHVVVSFLHTLEFIWNSTSYTKFCVKFAVFNLSGYILRNMKRIAYFYMLTAHSVIKINRNTKNDIELWLRVCCPC